jgi:hypothetical protein
MNFKTGYQNVLSKSIHYSRQWHLHGQGKSSLIDPRASLNCQEAWQVLDGFGKEQIIVAVPDDGCLVASVPGHDKGKFIDLAYLENNRLITGLSDNVKHAMYIPNKKHGSAICSLIASALTQSKPVGVIPNAKLLPIRWEYNGGYKISQAGFERILDYVSDKVDIMICTWASTPNFIFSESNITRIKELATKGGRRGKGIVFIWAAGNSAVPIDFLSTQPIPYRGYVADGVFLHAKYAVHFTHSLKNIDNVALVSAISSQAQRSHYSSYGYGLSLCAPSNNTHCFTDDPLSGLGITTASADDCGYTHNFKGTSASAALVAGVAGLILSANNLLTATDVVNIMKKTASSELNFAGYPEEKFFDPNEQRWCSTTPLPPFDRGCFSSSVWSPWFGYGKVDARAAVEYAITIKTVLS